MRNYFYFNQREKNGIITLIILIISVFCLSFFIHGEDKPISLKDKELIMEWVDSLYLKPKNSKNNPGKLNRGKNMNRIKKLYIELNAADSLTLVQIRGIGPVFAKRIIKYRKILGGYYCIDQLHEVYGIDSIKFENIKDHFIACDTSKIKKININTSGFKELLKHPYISYDFVKRIVNARRKELFKSTEDLLKRGVMPDSLYQKIQAYIKTK